uniref:WD repeat-containing protein 91 n=1 Tax=Neogobius melanostomus TaxID=47308 RepID=A0A8C6TDJ6_9GOBI
MASAVERTDELVREYLIYRGFSNALKQLDADIKADKDKGFRVDRILEQLQQLVLSFDLAGLREYWAYLEKRLFSRLEDVYRSTVHKLRTSLYRYYVVSTIQRVSPEKTQEFFLKLGPELQGQVEWRDWFVLPFLQAPEQNPLFATYFSRQWADTFLVSLHNFLSVLFQFPPQPILLNFDVEVQRMITVSEENEQLRQMLFALQMDCRDQQEQSLVHHKLPPYEYGPVKEVKPPSPSSQPGAPRHRRIQEHEKERKELFTKPTVQTPEKKGDSEVDSPPLEPSSRAAAQGGAPSLEHPFIKLSQEEYGEHHSSIMHCSCEGKLKMLSVFLWHQVWSFNPMMQTKATIMSKSPLLSLEWATKPDRLLLLGSGVGTVRLYDTDAKKNLYEMNIDEAHPRILSLACSPSGSSFICSAAALSRGGTGEGRRVPVTASGQLLLWDTKTVKQQLRFSLEPEPVAINCTAFNHNGNLLVTGAADGIIRLFDMQRYDCPMSWRAHDGEVYSVEFSYDENTVYSIGEDGKFIQWNIHRCGVRQSEQALAQEATGPFVLSGYSGYKQVQTPRGRLFAFDSEGQHVLTCSSSGGVIHRLTGGESGALEAVLSLGGHRAPVVTVDWCSAVDCGTCLTGSMDGKIKLSTLLASKS